MDDREVQEFGGPWTAIKIEILKKYLDAYTSALKYQPSKNTPFELIYIDAFAGAGKYKVKGKAKDKTEKLFDISTASTSSIKSGSAKTALEIKNPFHNYYFIDIDNANVSHLHELKDEFPEIADRIHVNSGEAGQVLHELCARTNWRMKRAVLFLDPFNLEISWETIEVVAKTQAIDMWFLFPISAVNRMLPRSGVVDKTWQKKLNDVFGSPCWEKEFYSESKQMSLLDINNPKCKKDTDFEGIKKYIINRLKSIFPGVSKTPRILRNSSNSPLFVLFFAVGNKRGSKLALKIADHILQNT